MYLATVIKWSMQVILPLKILLFSIPVLDVVLSVLAVCGVEIATLEITR